MSVNPWAILAALVFWLASVAAGVGAGVRIERNACQAAKAKAEAVQVEQHNERAAAGQVAEHKSAERVARTEAVFNGINQVVLTHAQTHPAASDCSLDDDGLRLWRAANADADPDPAGGGPGAVPGNAAAAGQRPDDGPAGKPRDGGEGLPPVQGPSQRPGAVAEDHGQ